MYRLEQVWLKRKVLLQLPIGEVASAKGVALACRCVANAFLLYVEIFHQIFPADLYAYTQLKQILGLQLNVSRGLQQK